MANQSVKEYSLNFQGYWREVNKGGVPSKSGIYLVYRCLYNPEQNTVGLKEILYIGQAEDARKRIVNHDKLDEFNECDFYGRNNTKVKVGAGYSLLKLSLMAAKKGLTGLEFASGIPGTVGGAVFMNAGAYKTDMGYIVESVKVLTPDFKVIKLENKEMDFHYRTSFLQKHRDYICLEVVLKLAVGKREAIEEVIKERRIRREESQPLEYPSAGSVFRNPPDNFAGKLVEDCGLKGLIKGGAMISDKHANFVINYKDASSDDIKYLIDLAHDKVLEAVNAYNEVKAGESEYAFYVINVTDEDNIEFISENPSSFVSGLGTSYPYLVKFEEEQKTVTGYNKINAALKDIINNLTPEK